MSSVKDDRPYWIGVLTRIAEPVLRNLAERTLKKNMPVEGDRGRAAFTHLEALGRTLAGIAPWLASRADGEHEEDLRRTFSERARAAIDAGTDPGSPDFLNFGQGAQPLVDAAFLAHAILRAPVELWEKLDSRVKTNLLRAFRTTRTIKPFFNNWLLFGAMIETALYRLGEEWDPMRIDYAVKQHEQWYCGDGIYADGPEFHWDYYNGFVIHPMLVDIVSVMGERYSDWKDVTSAIMERARRYAAIQERLISPEGTFPPVGRSLAYRFGAFQLLGQMALRHDLPGDVSPPQVRCALTAVIRRIIEMPGTFDENGWLRTGVCGSQPAIGEPYISTGSLYMCATGLLPLGLASDDKFWEGKDEDWTSLKLWSGKDLKADKSLRELNQHAISHNLLSLKRNLKKKISGL